MSRSRRHTPIIGIAKAESEKRDKQIASRRVRRAVRVRMGDDVLPLSRELSNPCCFAKDGKAWVHHQDAWRWWAK